MSLSLTHMLSSVVCLFVFCKYAYSFKSLVKSDFNISAVFDRSEKKNSETRFFVCF